MRKTRAKGLDYLLGVATAFLALALALPAQTPRVIGGDPRDVVESYWNMGVRGELLTRDGWERASGNFEGPAPFPQDASFDVFSDYYGFNLPHITSDAATVEVEFTNVGHVDAALRYTPPRQVPRGVLKTAFLFRLAVTPVYILMYGPDGKTVVEKRPTGNSAWRIVEPGLKRWATVNTAIRRVLEMRSKTEDAATRKNADETLAKLLTLH